MITVGLIGLSNCEFGLELVKHDGFKYEGQMLPLFKYSYMYR
jgi:hypothetical protein